MKTVIITGASSGIGRQAALLFAGKGWRVAATMRNPGKLAMFAGETNIKTYLMDVRDARSVAECIGRITGELGTVTAIVNNAGVFTTDPLEATPDGVIDAIAETNIRGVMLVTKTIIPHFRERGGGVIVNVSSIAGRATFPFQSVYQASKWAVEGFSESLRYELAPTGIRVKMVEPGMVKTPLYDSVKELPIERYPEAYRAGFAKWHDYLMEQYGNGYPPERDAATIYRAVTSRGRKLRYTTDFNTRMVFFLRRILPSRAHQWFIGKMSGA